MDYIILNTLIYGVVGLCFVYFLAYYKILNLSLGAFLVLGTFFTYLWVGGNQLEVGFIPGLRVFMSGENPLHMFLFLGFTLGLYCLIPYIAYRFFQHALQRDLFAIIFTMATAVLVENLLGFFFGGGAVSFSAIQFSTPTLFLILLLLVGTLIYLFRVSFLGKFFTGIAENAGVVKSLGFHVHKSIFIGSLGCFALLLLAGVLVLTREGVKPTDGVFYLIVGVAMLVVTGVKKIHLVFFAALLYVVLEYVLFVFFQMPLAFKSPTMLVIILLLLLFKPEGVFTFRSRTL